MSDHNAIPPEGFSLLAARLLLREIGDKPIDQERLAALLDDVIGYSWAVRLILAIGDHAQWDLPIDAFHKPLRLFRERVEKNLLGYPRGNEDN